MSKKSMRPYEGPHTEGRCEVARDLASPHPYQVVCGGKVVAVIHSRRARMDAERIATALNMTATVPSEAMRDDLLSRMTLLLADLLDVVETTQHSPKRQAYVAGVVERAKTTLARLSAGTTNKRGG